MRSLPPEGAVSGFGRPGATDMRASLIGRFLLLSIFWLLLLLPAWYWAARWLAVPPIWLAGTAMKALFSWVDGFHQEGVTAVLQTLVQVRMKGAQGDVLGELAPEVSYPSYGYGLVLLWAMLLAARTEKWWWKGLIGSLLLLPAQAVSIFRVEEDQALHHVLLRPADKLGADVAVLHLQRPGTRQLDGTPNPPPFPGDRVQRVLTKGAVAQQAGFALQPGAARRLAAGLQDQLFQRRNALKRRAALHRHILKLAAVIEGHHAQLRPFAAAGGHPVEMVKTRVKIRARNICSA